MFKNDFEDDSSVKVLIESVNDIQLTKHKDRLFKLLNKRNNQSFIDVNDKLYIDEGKIKISHLMYHLLLILSLLFLYEIVKLSKEFPDSYIMNIKHPEGSESKVINIPK